jgi:DNA-binding NarL/FixJ family response regulator
MAHPSSPNLPTGAGAAVRDRLPDAPHDDSAADRRLRCFIVEDSPVIRQNLIAMLEELLPIEVVGEAEDERDALSWLDRGGDADLTIIDVFLKSGSGLEVLGRAREAGRGGKLVVLSNYATPDIRRRCAALGADRVFDKSGELDELIAYCAELTERSAS